jgi:preprotein translocase subunit SecG
MGLTNAIPEVLKTTGSMINTATPLRESIDNYTQNQIKKKVNERIGIPKTGIFSNVKNGINSSLNNIIRDGDAKETLARNRKFLIYFSLEKILTAISVVLVICYTVFILVMHHNAKSNVEKKSVEFSHEVLWGSAGTDGTLYYISKLMFGFVVLMCAGKFLFTLIKTNTYIFDSKEDIERRDATREAKIKADAKKIADAEKQVTDERERNAKENKYISFNPADVMEVD